MLRVSKQETNHLIAPRVKKATRLLERMKGLLGSEKLETGEGLWIEPCNSIHTWFMRYPIDALFVSKTGQVLRLYRNLAPFRITRWVKNAHAVLELPAGSLREVAVGDTLNLEETS